MTKEEIERVIYLSYQYTEIVRNEGPLRQSKIDFILEGLKEQQPLLPANIDEAAEEYMETIQQFGDASFTLYADVDVKNAFQAGAEWMAGQGETFNGFMSVRGKRSLIAIEGSSQNFKFGEGVIVQIRKKEE